MERVLSQDERIRRAEEIYARRKMKIENRTSATVNVDEGNSQRLTRKLIIQCVICLIIYGTFYAVKNIPNIVSQEMMYKISDILEYDINIQELYKNFNSYINKNDNQDEQINETNNLIEETLSITDGGETTENVDNNESTENIQNTEGLEEKNSEEQSIDESSSLSQMEIDAEYIKANCVMMKPLEGEITSRFGVRNPTVPTVPKYHTGIDIARVTGTVIVSAMEGDVELVSSEGDLRKSHKNNKWRSKYSICTLQ